MKLIPSRNIREGYYAGSEWWLIDTDDGYVKIRRHNRANESSALRKWPGIKPHIVDKSKWPAGEWTLELDAFSWYPINGSASDVSLHGVILRNSNSGNLCGYIGVPYGHVLFGKDCWDDPLARELEAHGGVNISGHFRRDKGFNRRLWYFGFDCGHIYDVSPGYLNDEVATGGWHGESVYRTVSYVANQVERLARQLNRIQKEHANK